jgi:hypothetical protein
MKEQVKGILIKRDGFEGLPNDQWYDEFAQEICDVFSPKGKIPPVLSDEEILAILGNHWENFLLAGYRQKLITTLIQQAKDETRFNLLEWFRYYAHQLDRKFPNPTTEEGGWLGNIWDMIKMAGKEDADVDYIHQAKEEVGEILEWGNQKCLTHHTSMNNVLHRDCWECWQALKDRKW